ncbi:MAG: tRNA (N6-isopentenyl adenosine(37)-C2)-methylthiotransferase MiaB [Candidatus Magasanikbacteria bacterium]
MKKQYYYHILTFGCQMNKNDSERIESILQSMGLKSTEKMESADVILLNTCSVRETAENRIFGYAETFLRLKEEKPHLVVGITGCMPGRDAKQAMKSRLHGVDLYFPTKDMVMLPQWLSELNPNLRPIDLHEDYLSVKPAHSNRFQAFVTIQTGCNHFCTYCVVPSARGLERNRSLKDILDEAKSLASSGCKEITLLGQIVNHWSASDPENFSVNNPYKENDFAKLLWEINQIDDIERIHFTAAHPLYMDDEVIDALTLPKQVNYIHLPVQSGSSDVLKRMNRRHNREFYLETIKKIRNKKPDIAIGTDIIVGFSGETEKDFEDTLSLYRACDFDISYNAQYSVRPGTPAAKAFKDDVTKQEKKRRWDALQELMEDVTARKNKVYDGGKLEIFVDQWNKEYCMGNSREMKLCRFKGDRSLVGTIQTVKITSPSTWILEGDVV